MENEILDIEKNKVDEDQNYTIAEEYRLPSEGKIYGVPFDPKIKLRSMTVQEEMMRANQSKSMNATLCEIIDRCLITKLPISTYDLALPDYEYLLHKLRVVSYGPEYKMVVGCPHCRKEQSYVANLDTLKVKPFDEKEYMNNLIFTLPVSKKEIKLRIPTARLEDEINDKVEQFNSEHPDYPYNITPLITMETMIETINGARMGYVELQQLIKHMQVADYNYIDQKLQKIKGCIGLDKKIDIKCKHCGGKFSTFFRWSIEFFRPEID